MSGRGKAVALAPAGVLSTREKLWRAMRELKTFRVPDLARAAGIDRHKYDISDYLRGLVNAGIVTVAEAQRRPGTFTTFTLSRDLGVDAPRVRRDGFLLAEPVQQVLWRGMKVLREFSAGDLVAHASMAGCRTSPATVDRYCRWLERGGYLATQWGQSGYRYRLVKDTGPRAPQILHVKQLFDANTGKIMAGQTIQEALDESDAVAIRKPGEPGNGCRAEGAA